MRKKTAVLFFACIVFISTVSRADSDFEKAEKYFNVENADGEATAQALSQVTVNLIEADLPNAASYFFIRTLKTKNRKAIQTVLPELANMIDAVGGDLLRKYILGFTQEADYDSDTRNHFFHFLGKDLLLKGDASQALNALNRVSSGSGVLPQVAYLRGTAHAVLGQTQAAIHSFQSCQKMASRIGKEGDDLEARCTASAARSYYEAGNYSEAEETYDEIPKTSFVWTDILFEQAWNAYAKGDMNRALGKLVVYGSPSLNFVFNPEVEVLRAQSFLSLCLYDDVEKTVSDFNSKYSQVAGQMKNFLVSNDRNLYAFWDLAKQVFHQKLHGQSMLNRALNRFIRGPYFARLVFQERAVAREIGRVKNLGTRDSGFDDFLLKVLDWRLKTIRLLGGLFVKNSLYDQYQDMIALLDKMSFIKLEMLKHSKTRLERKMVMSEDEYGVLKRGAPSIHRKDYQYFWRFNGEFWSDELGDYVFALASECAN